MNTTKQTAVLEGDEQIDTHRQAARLVGVLFILATVSAIVGLLLYQPILAGPNYLSNGAAHKNPVILGVLMELILVGTAIGTAIGLFPVLRQYSERLALGHLFFRFLEAIAIMIGIVSVLSLLTLSQAFAAAAAPDASVYHAVGTTLLAVKSWSFMLGPLLFLGVNTMMYSYLLFKSNLVPRPLAILGLAGSTLVLGSALLVLLGIATQSSTVAVLLAMPIAVYEMILAVWLIVKGFNATAIASRSARIATKELLIAA